MSSMPISYCSLNKSCKIVFHYIVPSKIKFAKDI